MVKFMIISCSLFSLQRILFLLNQIPSFAFKWVYVKSSKLPWQCPFNLKQALTFVRNSWPHNNLQTIGQSAVPAAKQDTNASLFQDKFVMIVCVFHGPSWDMRLSLSAVWRITQFCRTINPFFEFIVFFNWLQNQTKRKKKWDKLKMFVFNSQPPITTNNRFDP